jgi:Rps23 Pro-64 3,4-dihydroxylase Tpa1-like proline 4-hydroxylase
MKIEIYYDPVFHVIIRDVFTKKENKQILKEALSLEDKFVDSYIGNNKKQNKEFRSNKSAFYDDIYNNNRNKSILLKKIDIILSNNQITEILGSSEYPFTDFGNTNTHETQVSRYGEDQKYNWHIDAVQARQRTITFVYWFHDIPKKFTGGELQITKSPIYDGELMGSGEVKTVEPENNTMIIFSANNSHRVINAKSPKTFKDGRFSVNCWVGIR